MGSHGGQALILCVSPGSPGSQGAPDIVFAMRGCWPVTGVTPGGGQDSRGHQHTCAPIDGAGSQAPGSVALDASPDQTGRVLALRPPRSLRKVTGPGRTEGVEKAGGPDPIAELTETLQKGGSGRGPHRASSGAKLVECISRYFRSLFTDGAEFKCLLGISSVSRD